MSDIDVLLPPEKDIKILGRDYTVRKLGLAVNIRVLRFIGSLQEDARAKIIADVESGKSDMAVLIENIASEKLPELIGILLDSKDDFSTISLEDFSEVVLAITETNDFEKIVSNFQGAAKNLKGIAEKIKGLLSLPSSQKSQQDSAIPLKKS